MPHHTHCSAIDTVVELLSESGLGNAIRRLPDWFVKGQPKPPGGRVTFATWKHWSAGDPLSESGLIGPVVLETAQFWPLPESA